MNRQIGRVHGGEEKADTLIPLNIMNFGMISVVSMVKIYKN
jgi:hypothetical protein